jgi:hypothetical protein
MALLELKRDATDREVRQFTWGWLPAACLVLAAWVGFRHEAWSTSALLAGAAMASVLLGALAPRAARALFLGWMWAAYPIGWLASHAAIAGIYFLLVAPLGLVMRIAGRDPLGLKLDRQAETYWRPRSASRDPSRYFRQF